MREITMADLKTEFVNYYEKKLEPYGFRKVKGRHPYFVRVVNDEILHIFTFQPRGFASNPWEGKYFWLICGVATVYRKEINFSVAPSNNCDWLISLGTLCERKETDYPDSNQPRDYKDFVYNEGNITSVLNETEDGTKLIIRELNKIKNMDDALGYFLKYNTDNITFDRWDDSSRFDEESLYYARKEFDYNKIEKIFEKKRLDLDNCSWSNEEKKIYYEGLPLWKERLKNARDKFINNKEVYEEGMKLLKERYETNVDKLIGYGLDIKKHDLCFD